MCQSSIAWNKYVWICYFNWIVIFLVHITIFPFKQHFKKSLHALNLNYIFVYFLYIKIHFVHFRKVFITIYVKINANIILVLCSCIILYIDICLMLLYFFQFFTVKSSAFSFIGFNVFERAGWTERRALMLASHAVVTEHLCG